MELLPSAISELREGTGHIRPRATPVPPMALLKFKFKVKLQKDFTAVWSSKHTGMRRAPRDQHSAFEHAYKCATWIKLCNID